MVSVRNLETKKIIVNTIIGNSITFRFSSLKKFEMIEESDFGLATEKVYCHFLCEMTRQSMIVKCKKHQKELQN